jgi:putative FmdB family regulatory protein
MPLYEYSCSSCGARLERRQRFDDPPLRNCPSCEGLLNRLIHPVGIVFKGSGWYSTDHRSTKGLGLPADGATSSTDLAAPTEAKESNKKEEAKRVATAKD